MEKQRVRRNNELKNAIRAAGWNSITDFAKCFNLDRASVTRWANGSVESIFYKQADQLQVKDLCTIFDCSKEELDNMVRNAFAVKNGRAPEPKEVALGDKNETINRVYENGEVASKPNEIPLEDFLAENIGEKAEKIKANTVCGVAEELGIEESKVRPIKKPQRAYYVVKKPIVLGEKGMDREDLVEHILNEAYGKIPYKDFISLGNVLRDWTKED